MHPDPASNRPGRLERWRLEHPVRFYVYPPLALLLLVGPVVLIAAPVIAAAGLLPLIVAALVGVECAAHSTLSPVALIRARQEQTR